MVVTLFACLLAWRAHAGDPPRCPVASGAAQAANCGAAIFALLGIDGKPAATVWRGEGSVLAFSLQMPGATAAPAVKVSIRFRKQPWADAAVWLDRTEASGPTYYYKAFVPQDLPSDRNFFIVARTGLIARTGEIQVAVLDPGGAAVAVAERPLGITKAWEAALVALAATAAGLFFVQKVVQARDVPGDWLLGVISNRKGAASLSQLQVMLWTFVIGGGAVFVMALSGELITIPPGALVLLGIAGFAGTVAKVKDGQDPPAQTGPKVPVPDAVTDLALAASPDDSEIVLTWTEAFSGGPARDYLVRFRLASVPPGPWLTARDTVAAPPFVVSGLVPATAYEFQVTARNEAGLSASSAGLTASTAAQNVAAGAPGRVTGLRATPLTRGGSVALAWDAVPGATGYAVQVRVHQSAGAWSSAAVPADRVLSGLVPGETYDVRVAARAAGALPDGPWSAAVTATMTQQPRWADLVVRPRDSQEIDVPRLQMLFFTLITAGFVALKIIYSQAIPDIPDGFLALMGISNGLYLTAKFIPDR